MRFASLGSGSEGNGLVVESGGTRVLIDCGFGVRGAATRLGRLGLAPSSLAAILVTHEHSDHVGGRAGVRGAPRHSRLGHVRHARRGRRSASRAWRTSTASTATTGSRSTRWRSCRFRFRTTRASRCSTSSATARIALGVLTDLGVSTAHVEASLSGCDALVLECNHDLDLLESGDYPVSAEAADRRAPRPPAQRGGRATSWRASTPRGSSTSSPRTCRSRTTRRSSRGPRSRRRSAVRRTGSASPTRRRVSTGARCSVDGPRRNTWSVPSAICPTGEGNGTAAGALQGQGQDGLRDRRSALPRHALSRRRVGVRRRRSSPSCRRRARPTTRSTPT